MTRGISFKTILKFFQSHRAALMLFNALLLFGSWSTSVHLPVLHSLISSMGKLILFFLYPLHPLSQLGTHVLCHCRVSLQNHCSFSHSPDRFFVQQDRGPTRGRRAVMEPGHMVIGRVGTARGRARHLGRTHGETQRSRLWAPCGHRRSHGKISLTPPGTTNTTSIRRLVAAIDAQTHTMLHPAQPRHTNHWAPQTGKQYHQEHQPQRPTTSNDRTQHANGKTGKCPGPCEETTNQRNVSQRGTY